MPRKMSAPLLTPGEGGSGKPVIRFPWLVPQLPSEPTPPEAPEEAEPPAKTLPPPTSVPVDVQDYEREQERRLGINPAGEFSS